MKTETIVGGFGEERSDTATAEHVRGAFVSHREELTWLARFLNGDEKVANACVIDASLIAAVQGDLSQDAVIPWAQLATINSAITMRKLRIAELGSVYEHSDCPRQGQTHFPRESIEFVIEQSDEIESRLDVLCRFVLIMCGVERWSSGLVALLLGISRPAVEAAYCSVLESLETMYCQLLIDESVCAAA